ncbi:hypothetical protein ACFQ0T_02520 [Kitasatospora gansuensis]
MLRTQYGSTRVAVQAREPARPGWPMTTAPTAGYSLVVADAAGPSVAFSSSRVVPSAEVPSPTGV